MWLFGLKRLFSFPIILFFKSTCHLSHFEWNKKGPPFSLDVTYAQPQEEGKNLTFETLKSCLGLHAVSLVPVPRISLHPSGPVSESRQYVYQNAQNETPSVVQRLALLNFKLHAKR